MSMQKSACHQREYTTVWLSSEYGVAREYNVYSLEIHLSRFVPSLLTLAMTLRQPNNIECHSMPAHQLKTAKAPGFTDAATMNGNLRVTKRPQETTQGSSKPLVSVLLQLSNGQMQACGGRGGLQMHVPGCDCQQTGPRHHYKPHLRFDRMRTNPPPQEMTSYPPATLISPSICEFATRTSPTITAPYHRD